MGSIRSIRAIWKPVLPAVLLAFTVVGAAASASVISPRSSGPKFGGTLTIGGSPPTALYFQDPAYNAGPTGLAQSMLIMGSLFLPDTKGSGFLPNLATSYTFNKASTVFTMQLRPGVKFEDGTPFNAAAVAWNWSGPIDGNPVTKSATYLTSVTSVTTKGKYTVIVHFSQPDSPFIADIAAEEVGLMESPTAYETRGESAIDQDPIGAGAYKVASNTPGQNLVLTKNPSFWDAKNVYLSEINYINTGTDPTANYNDLQSGAISVDSLAGSAPAAITAEAIANPNYNLKTSPNYSYAFMPMSDTPPFNNQLAREAIDYCTDRATIAADSYAGYVSPAYVMAGPANYWYPTQNGKPSIAAAMKLMPYQYNVAKGTSIVQQLGGLSFTLDTTSTYQTLVTAMVQEWTSCGIKASISIIPSANQIPILQQGTYQAFVTTLGGSYDSRLSDYYITPQQTLDPNGEESDPVVINLWNKMMSLTSNTTLTADFHKFWSQINTDAELIPIISFGNYVFSNKCVHNIEFNYSTNYLHAWLSCSPT